MQPPQVTCREYDNFSHQSSKFDQNFFMLVILGDIISKTRLCFPQNDATNHIETDLELLPVVFCSLFDKFTLVEDPDKSKLFSVSFSSALP